MPHVDAPRLAAHPRAVGGSAGSRQRSTRVVHQALRSSIKNGLLKPGDALNEDEIIELLDSTRSSVRTALQMLADEGLVSRRRRSGTIVRGKPIQIMMNDIVTRAHATPIEYLMINDQQIPGTGLIKDRLKTGQDRVRMVEYVLKAGGFAIGTLVAFQISPNALTPVHTVDMAEIADTFQRVFGAEFGRMDCWVDAVPADDRTARLLKIPVGSILLVRDQVLTDIHGTVHEFGYAHYRADLVSFRTAP
jgi:GntR family transcriptional regulator